MARRPTVQGVDLEGDYYHVRFHDPGEFAEIRTPEWAATAAGHVSTGSKVRMGRREGGDDWAIQSVLIAKQLGKTKAREQAKEIFEKLES